MYCISTQFFISPLSLRRNVLCEGNSKTPTHTFQNKYFMSTQVDKDTNDHLAQFDIHQVSTKTWTQLKEKGYWFKHAGMSVFVKLQDIQNIENFQEGLFFIGIQDQNTQCIQGPDLKYLKTTAPISLQLQQHNIKLIQLLNLSSGQICGMLSNR